MRIYIVEISCQLLNVLLQLIRRLQAILEETGEQRVMRNEHSDQQFMKMTPSEPA